MRLPLVHSCGAVVLWATERPIAGTMPVLSTLFLADGGRLLAGTQIRCETCHAPVTAGNVTPEGGWR